MTIARVATPSPMLAQHGLRLPQTPALFVLPMLVDAAAEGSPEPIPAASEDADTPADLADPTAAECRVDVPMPALDVRPVPESVPWPVTPAPPIVVEALAAGSSVGAITNAGYLPGPPTARRPDVPVQPASISRKRATADPKISESVDTRRPTPLYRSPEIGAVEIGAVNRASRARLHAPLSAPPPSLKQPIIERADVSPTMAASVRPAAKAPVFYQLEPTASQAAPLVPIENRTPVVRASDAAALSAQVVPAVLGTAEADARAALNREIQSPTKAASTPHSITDPPATAMMVDTRDRPARVGGEPLRPAPTASIAVRPLAEIEQQIGPPSTDEQISIDVHPATRRTVTVQSRMPAAAFPQSAERPSIEPALEQARPGAGGRLAKHTADQLMSQALPVDGNAALVTSSEQSNALVAPIVSGMTASVPATAVPMPTPTLPVLDIDAGGQWIDRLALEISAAVKDGGARLKLTPDNLGELTIAIRGGDSGASVVITTQDEAVRSMLAGAQDRLVGEARAHGLRLADVQTQLSGETGAAPQQHGRQMPPPVMWDGDKQPKRMMWIESDNHKEAISTGRWA